MAKKTASDVAGIISQLVPLIGLLKSKNGAAQTGQQQSQALANMPPQIQALLNMQVQNAQTAQPLYQNAISATNRLLPAWARNGQAGASSGGSTSYSGGAGGNTSPMGQGAFGSSDKGGMSDAAFSSAPRIQDVSGSASTDVSGGGAGMGGHDAMNILELIAAALSGGFAGAGLQGLKMLSKSKPTPTILPYDPR